MNNLEKLYIAKYAKGRCWDGYEPVPGKKPYSNDSCRPVGSKKKKKKKKEEKKESKEKYAMANPPKDEVKKKPSQPPTKQRRVATLDKKEESPKSVAPKNPAPNALLDLPQQPSAKHVLPYVLGGDFKKDVTNKGTGLLSDFTGLNRRTIDRIGDIGEMGLKQRADFKLGPWDISAGRTGNFDRGGLEISRSF
tara:strand:+ start:21914 stop:22492 length:579 start_codon:yes stop_codon:yes gene_type:complete